MAKESIYAPNHHLGSSTLLRPRPWHGLEYERARQWSRVGLIRPSIREPEGRGRSALYSFEDVVLLRVVCELRDGGVPMSKLHDVVPKLRDVIAKAEPRVQGCGGSSPSTMRSSFYTTAMISWQPFNRRFNVIDVATLQRELVSRCGASSASPGP